MRSQQQSSSGSRQEIIASMAGLMDALKTLQIAKPRAQFALAIGGEKFSVNLLPTGYIEVDGRVQPIQVEKEFDLALASVGATLYTVN